MFESVNRERQVSRIAKERLMPKRSKLTVISCFTAFLLVGCRVSAPEKGSDTITLMARYNQQGDTTMQ